MTRITRTAKASALVSAVLVALFLLSGLAYYVVTRSPGNGKPVVVASFYPYAFAAQSVGRDRVNVANLVPPGVEPHDWEPSPLDVKAIYDARVFVYNGYLEAYVPRILAELPSNGPILVNTSAGLPLRTENGQVDPHVWLDPRLMSIIAGKIAAALSRADPAGADYYRANAASLNASLEMIHADYVTGLANCGLRTIVVAHEAFGYLSARYGLTMVAIQGLSPDAEPTPQKIQQILDTVHQTGAEYIFYEALVSPQVAQTLADEAHVQTLVLDPLEGIASDRLARGENYLTIMENTNLPNLRTALQCA